MNDKLTRALASEVQSLRGELALIRAQGRKDLDEKSIRLEEARREIQELKESLQNSRETYMRKKENEYEFQKDLKNAMDKLASMASKLRDAELRAKRIQGEKNELERKIARKEKDRTPKGPMTSTQHHKIAMEELHRKLDVAKKKVDSLERAALRHEASLDAERQKQIAILQKEKKKDHEYQGQLKALAHVVITVRADLKASEEKRRNEHAKFQKLEAVHISTTEGYNRTVKELENLKNNLRKAEEQNTELSVEICEHKLNLERLRNELGQETETHASTKAQAKRKHEAAQRTMDAFKAQLAETRNQVKEQRKANADLESELSRVKYECTNLQARITRAEAKCERSIKELTEKSKSELEALRTSLTNEYETKVQKEKKESKKRVMQAKASFEAFHEKMKKANSRLHELFAELDAKLKSTEDKVNSTKSTVIRLRDHAENSESKRKRLSLELENLSSQKGSLELKLKALALQKETLEKEMVTQRKKFRQEQIAQKKLFTLERKKTDAKIMELAKELKEASAIREAHADLPTKTSSKDLNRLIKHPEIKRMFADRLDKMRKRCKAAWEKEQEQDKKWKSILEPIQAIHSIIQRCMKQLLPSEPCLLTLVRHVESLLLSMRLLDADENKSALLLFQKLPCESQEVNAKSVVYVDGIEIEESASPFVPYDALFHLYSSTAASKRLPIEQKTRPHACRDNTEFRQQNYRAQSFTSSGLDDSRQLKNNVIRRKSSSLQRKRKKRTLHSHTKRRQKPSQIVSEKGEAENGEKWVQCDHCKKWRQLEPSTEIDSLPPLWYCPMNTWDPHHNLCSHPEDPSHWAPAKYISSKNSDQRLLFKEGSSGEKGDTKLKDIQAVPVDLPVKWGGLRANAWCIVPKTRERAKVIGVTHGKLVVMFRDGVQYLSPKEARETLQDERPKRATSRRSRKT